MRTNCPIFFLCVLCTFAVIWGSACKRQTPPTPPTTATPTPPSASVAFVPVDPQLIAANNRAVGLMGRFQYEEARAMFQQLLEQHPNWHEVRVNLAIATLNRQREGDEEAALELLDHVLAVDPNHWRAHYCAGLLRLYLSSPQDARDHFQQVAEGDPQDAYAAYYIGQCLAQLGDYAQAVTWFERAMANDTYLRSAYYAASQAYRAVGNDEKSRQMRDAFQQLERNPRSKLVEFKYKRMGPKSEAEVVNAVPAPAPLPKPGGPIFADPVPLLTNGDEVQWIIRRDDRPVSITACDINGDGFIDIFIANVIDSDGIFNAVCMNNGDDPPTFTLDTDHILASIPDVNAALWGDYDNDGLTDVYLCRRGPNMLWQQHKKNEWQDVTAATGTANDEYDSVDGAIFDADHDGDLDIFVVNYDGPNELFNNNLDGTFRAIAHEQGIAGEGRGSIQVLPVDLDGDRDLDIIVINREPPHDVWINDRMWRYAPAGIPAIRNQAVNAALAIDAEMNGSASIVVVRENGEIDLVRKNRLGEWHSTVRHHEANTKESIHNQIAAAYFDGSGDLIVITFNASEMGTWQWSSWDEAFWPLSSVSNTLQGWAHIVYESARGPCAVGIGRDMPPIISHPGPGRHQFATLSFTGRKDGDTMRSNASGIGTHFAARVDSMWVTGHTLKNSSGPGQSLQPVAIGLGGHSQIDFLSIDWSDGVFQSEIDLQAGEHHTIVETQRQLSSCPVLFAWNGTKHEFVSDVLGVGGMGYMVAPHEYAEPRPWENFMLPVGMLQPKDGRFILKLGEPMEEACYLDAARLVAYDLPPGWQMTLDERMSILGPAPTGETRFYWDELQPVHAINDRGEDVTEAILTADLKAPPVGEHDHRFIGRLKDDHVITFRFEMALNPSDHALSGTPLLVIDGWVEYPYSQTMFAAWQANADYRAPTVEARSDDGEWQVVLEQFGYPAGMPRQMSVPLENLPPNTTQLRLTTNQEIYFDRMAVAYAEPMPAQVIRRELPLAEARVLQTGFAQRTTGEQRQPYYDYDRRSPYWDTRYQRGEYTRIGPMMELIADVDDAVAIFGPGEEIHMEFGANLPPIPFTLAASGDGVAGQWTRVFVLELNGWCKDMDLFTKDGETIEPLPALNRDPAALHRRDELHRRFNTRYMGGR